MGKVSVIVTISYPLPDEGLNKPSIGKSPGCIAMR